MTARAKSAAFRSSASRCANGCSASPPTPRNCWPTSTRLTGAIRSRKCSGTGLAAAKARKWTFKLPIANCRLRIQRSACSPRGRTRLFGATYMVLAPEHRLGGRNHHRRNNATRLKNYREHTRAQKRSRTHRTGQGKNRRVHRRLRHQSGQRRKNSNLDCRLRSRQLRHRRHHGRAGARHARLRVRHANSICPIRSGRPSRQRSQKPIGKVLSDDGTSVNSRPGDFHHRPAHARSQKENHRLARRKKSRQENHQLQTARLAVQPSALLGRAVPDCLEKGRRRKSVSRSVAGKCVAAAAAVARRLQAHRRRPAAARPREGLAQSARRFRARNQHHAAMGRLVLVLSALSRREK